MLNESNWMAGMLPPGAKWGDPLTPALLFETLKNYDDLRLAAQLQLTGPAFDAARTAAITAQIDARNLERKLRQQEDNRRAGVDRRAPLEKK